MLLLDSKQLQMMTVQLSLKCLNSEGEVTASKAVTVNF